MDKAKRARTAETPKQPSLGLKLRAPYLYPDRAYSAIAPHRYPRAARGMSASPPLASVIWHPSAVPRRAICMARPCGTRWTSKTTNVRAASMYQASEVEQFAPGHHGYPRASEAD